ncbi:MAG TPA: alpha/beta hydrolase-fold protein [Puia sp.]|nr:alpha/beta hydrolase-fold protein [Puia sp.]
MRDSIYSSVLGEERPLWLIFPKDYQPEASGRYDVIYVIDGEWNTTFAGQVHSFLSGPDGKFMPPNVIIVGIPNLYKGDLNMRLRDFTPVYAQEIPVSGGGVKFLSFLKNELIPHINKTYPTNPDRNTFLGSSLGGMFCLYSMLTDPNLFKSYVVVDPGCLFNDFYINKLALEKLESLNGLAINLFIGGRENAYRIMGTDGLATALRTKAPVTLNWRCEIYPDESHFTTMWKTVFDGFKYAYAGFAPAVPAYNRVLDYPYKGTAYLRITPDNGIVLKNKPFTIWCYDWFPELLRYTADGSEPSTGSPRMKMENRFSGPVSLRVRSFYTRGEYDKGGFSGRFTTGAIFAPIQKPVGIRAGGMNYRYYEGDWDSLPDFSKLRPVRSGFGGQDSDLNVLGGQSNSAYVLDGYVEIPRVGYYIFELDGGDGFKIAVGDRSLINNKTGLLETYMVPLAKGFYPIHVEYFHKKGGNGLHRVYVRPEGRTDIPIPTHWLYGSNR